MTSDVQLLRTEGQVWNMRESGWGSADTGVTGKLNPPPWAKSSADLQGQAPRTMRLMAELRSSYR